MPEKLKRDIALKLAIVSRKMRRHFDKAVSELGVTRSQWSVIAVVAGLPGTTQRVIAEKLEISEPSAGRLVDRLLADGMVERRAKEDDRRAHAIFLTDKGNELTQGLARIAEASEKTAFSGMGEAELWQMLGLLERIDANLAGIGGFGPEQKEGPP